MDGIEIDALTFAEEGRPKRRDSAETDAASPPALPPLPPLPWWCIFAYLFFYLVLDRSIWNLMDIYILPSSFAASNWITLCVGVGGIVAIHRNFDTQQLYRWVY